MYSILPHAVNVTGSADRKDNVDLSPFIARWPQMLQQALWCAPVCSKLRRTHCLIAMLFLGAQVCHLFGGIPNNIAQCIGMQSTMALCWTTIPMTRHIWSQPGFRAAAHCQRRQLAGYIHLGGLRGICCAIFARALQHRPRYLFRVCPRTSQRGCLTLPDFARACWGGHRKLRAYIVVFSCFFGAGLLQHQQIGLGPPQHIWSPVAPCDPCVYHCWLVC